MSIQKFFTKPVQMLHKAATAEPGTLSPGERVMLAAPMMAMTGVLLMSLPIAVATGTAWAAFSAALWVGFGAFVMNYNTKAYADERLEGQPCDLAALGRGVKVLPSAFLENGKRIVRAAVTGKPSEEEEKLTAFSRYFPAACLAALPLLAIAGAGSVERVIATVPAMLGVAGPLSVPQLERARLRPEASSPG